MALPDAADVGGGGGPRRGGEAPHRARRRRSRHHRGGRFHRAHVRFPAGRAGFGAVAGSRRRRRQRVGRDHRRESAAGGDQESPLLDRVAPARAWRQSNGRRQGRPDRAARAGDRAGAGQPRARARGGGLERRSRPDAGAAHCRCESRCDDGGLAQALRRAGAERDPPDHRQRRSTPAGRRRSSWRRRRRTSRPCASWPRAAPIREPPPMAAPPRSCWPPAWYSSRARSGSGRRARRSLRCGSRSSSASTSTRPTSTARPRSMARSIARRTPSSRSWLAPARAPTLPTSGGERRSRSPSRASTRWRASSVASVPPSCCVSSTGSGLRARRDRRRSP